MRRLLRFTWRVVSVACVAIAAACAARSRDLELRPAELPAEFREDGAQVAAAFRRDPDDAAVLYQVAALLARSHRTDDALEALRRMAALGSGVDPRPRDGFAPLTENPEFRRIVAAIRAEFPPVLRAREMFVIDEADLIPEGIAWSAKTQRFYLGSIKSKIIAVDREGHTEPLIAPSEGGLGVVLGLRVDDARGELWAGSTRLNGQPPGGFQGLVRVRLADGRIVGRYEMAGEGYVNDVAVTPDGTAYATMTQLGQLMRVDGATGRVDQVLARGAVPDANGITFDPSRRALFVASWHDVYRVDLPSLAVTALAKPRNVASGCFDGLYAVGGDLVGIQNCVHATGRVMRLHLDPRADRIVSATVLESYNPLFDGVTTGAIANDALVFVANVQFRKMGKAEPFQPIHVLALPLSP